jgi:hypothetical protein
MKFIKNKFFYLIIFLLGAVQIYAAPHPPSPTGKRPPPPPGLTIDDGILLIIYIAIIYGLYIVYKYHSKKNRNSFN